MGVLGVSSSRCGDHDGSAHKREPIEFLKEKSKSLSPYQVGANRQEQRSEKGVGGGSVTSLEITSCSDQGFAPASRHEGA